MYMYVYYVHVGCLCVTVCAWRSEDNVVLVLSFTLYIGSGVDLRLLTLNHLASPRRQLTFLRYIITELLTIGGKTE